MNNSTCYSGITNYVCDCNCGWKGNTCNIGMYTQTLFILSFINTSVMIIGFYFPEDKSKVDCELKCYTYSLSSENEVVQPQYLVSCPEDFVCYREGKLFFHLIWFASNKI